jgi:hypothetical protein
VQRGFTIAIASKVDQFNKAQMRVLAIRIGTTRMVLIVGPMAIKLARHERGMRCNRSEATLYDRETPRRREILCPVIWCSENGRILIARAAAPARPEDRPLILARIYGWDYDPHKNEDPPFEPKITDWGWLDDRLVSLDYSVNVI